MGLVMADQVRAADANKEKNSARVPSFPFYIFISAADRLNGDIDGYLSSDDLSVN